MVYVGPSELRGLRCPRLAPHVSTTVHPSPYIRIRPNRFRSSLDGQSRTRALFRAVPVQDNSANSFTVERVMWRDVQQARHGFLLFAGAIVPGSRQSG